MHSKGSYPVELRVQALALASYGVKVSDVASLTGISERAVYDLIKRARDRGYNFQADPRIRREHVEDGKRSGRPKEITDEVKQAVIASIQKDRAGREKSSEVLAYEAGISQSSILHILKEAGIHSVKPTYKPGLTEEQKARRLRFCLDHKDWSLDDWKNVIFTDETSVVLGHRRGAVKVWRTTEDRSDPTVIRRRWKGVTEFMVHAAFSYDYKGPIHIFMPETAQAKKLAEREITIMNQENEAAFKAEWELNTGLQRMGLRNKGGRKPTWRFSKKNGLLIRESKGGIDWYRYRKVSLAF
jgi:transposase